MQKFKFDKQSDAKKAREMILKRHPKAKIRVIEVGSRYRQGPGGEDIYELLEIDDEGNEEVVEKPERRVEVEGALPLDIKELMPEEEEKQTVIQRLSVLEKEVKELREKVYGKGEDSKSGGGQADRRSLLAK